MVHDDVLKIYEMKTGIPTKSDEGCWKIGSYSVWMNDGTWALGHVMSSTPCEGWWDEGVDEVPDDESGGPFASFEAAIAAACRLEFESRLLSAGEEADWVTHELDG